MKDVLTIYEAKTNLSKYVRRAKAGMPSYIGTYGQREVMLVSVDVPAQATGPADLSSFLREKFELGQGLKSITDPKKWQKMMRKDRVIPGRE